MFKSPFSFSGRITRTEFGLTLIIFFFSLMAIFINMVFIDSVLGFKLSFILFFAAIWFRIAQSTKRCHDINVSGWYQLIPFYTFALLFENGKTRVNKYGASPKTVIVDEVCKTF